jgi:hypothetical protein
MVYQRQRFKGTELNSHYIYPSNIDFLRQVHAVYSQSCWKWNSTSLIWLSPMHLMRRLCGIPQAVSIAKPDPLAAAQGAPFVPECPSQRWWRRSRVLDYANDANTVVGHLLSL